jgi:hypothetical protein
MNYRSISIVSLVLLVWSAILVQAQGYPAACRYVPAIPFASAAIGAVFLILFLMLRMQGRKTPNVLRRVVNALFLVLALASFLMVLLGPLSVSVFFPSLIGAC